VVKIHQYGSKSHFQILQFLQLLHSLTPIFLIGYQNL